MTVATFLQSDYNTQSGTAYPLAIDGDIAVMARIAGQFAPHAAAAPNMTLVVDAGAIFTGGTSVAAVAQQTTAAFTAPAAGQSRIDRVVLGRVSGALSVITGTPAASSPLPPDIPAGMVACAQVLLTSSTTAITDAIIIDERELRSLGLGSAAFYDAGAAAGTVPVLDAAGQIPETMVAGLGSAALAAIGTSTGDVPVLDANGLVGPLLGGMPPGMIGHHAGQAPPAGWLVRDGSSVSRATYAALFAAIAVQTTGDLNATASVTVATTAGMAVGMAISGAGIPVGATIAAIPSGTSITLSAAATTTASSVALAVSPFGFADTTHFSLPDDRGVFPRGWDSGGSIDPGRAFGSYQADDFKSHTHLAGPVPGVSYDGGANARNWNISSTSVGTSSAAGGSETRPKNRAYLPIIKY